MSVVQHNRVGRGDPIGVASPRAGQRGNACRWVPRLFVCVLAIVWLPRAWAAPLEDAGESDASGSATSGAVSEVNPPLDFTLPVVTGGHWRLAEHRGRVVWLALVAPWCGQCAGFVDDVAARLSSADARLQASGAASGAAAGAAVADKSVFMVVSAVDARGDGLDVRIDPESAASDGRTLGASNVRAEGMQLLIDRDGKVLRTFDPDELPWLVRIDEDGVLVAAGTDLNVLAPARIEPGLWQDLRSRWRQLWGEQE